MSDRSLPFLLATDLVPIAVAALTASMETFVDFPDERRFQDLMRRYFSAQFVNEPFQVSNFCFDNIKRYATNRYQYHMSWLNLAPSGHLLLGGVMTTLLLFLTLSRRKFVMKTA